MDFQAGPNCLIPAKMLTKWNDGATPPAFGDRDFHVQPEAFRNCNFFITISSFL
jgi:hypothetical protein